MRPKLRCRVSSCRDPCFLFYRPRPVMMIRLASIVRSVEWVLGMCLSGIGCVVAIPVDSPSSLAYCFSLGWAALAYVVCKRAVSARSCLLCLASPPRTLRGLLLMEFCFCGFQPNPPHWVLFVVVYLICVRFVFSAFCRPPSVVRG